MTLRGADRQAETRVLRTVVLIFGISSLAFLGLTLGSIIRQWPHVSPVWSIAAVALIFGAPPIMAVASPWCSARVIKGQLGGYAIGSLAVTLCFPLCESGGGMPFSLNPWPLTIVALATVPAALAFRDSVAYGYLAAYSVAVGVVRFTAADAPVLHVALQDTVFAFTLAGVFTAIALVTRRSAIALDRAALEARETAVRLASAESRQREQARLDALLHDDVMSTLFYASTGGPELEAAVRKQAARALAELRTVDSAGDAPVDVTAFTSRLRSVALAGAASGSISFTVEGARLTPVPAAVDAAFAEAAAEAVRNSVMHAGAEASRTVTLRLSESRVILSVEDDGVGFEARDVRPHRLGILVSIRGRMAAVNGGVARVESSPGRGVLVELEWSAA